MTTKERLKLIIAETSPVISSGFAATLKKIRAPQLEITEVSTMDELSKCMIKKPDYILVNPTFGGIFNPTKFKDNYADLSFKIIAIELGKLSNQTSSLYDDKFHITDDIESFKSKLNALIGTKEENQEEKDTLSTREKEIIGLVVRGLTNQEIADKLFLSIHTVNTHRRNIAKKLEIHSATGLTIYAIVNKIVDIEDVVK